MLRDDRLLSRGRAWCNPAYCGSTLSVETMRLMRPILMMFWLAMALAAGTASAQMLPFAMFNEQEGGGAAAAPACPGGGYLFDGFCYKATTSSCDSYCASVGATCDLDGLLYVGSGAPDASRCQQLGPPVFGSSAVIGNYTQTIACQMTPPYGLSRGVMVTSSCSATPSAGNTQACSCKSAAGGSTCTLPWGGTIASGASVTAYQAANVACGGSCTSQTRTCNNGILSGTYTAQSCSVDACPFANGACGDGFNTECASGYRCAGAYPSPVSVPCNWPNLGYWPYDGHADNGVYEQFYCCGTGGGTDAPGVCIYWIRNACHT